MDDAPVSQSLAFPWRTPGLPRAATRGAGAGFARLQALAARCARCTGPVGVACCRWCRQWYLGCAGCAEDPRQCPDCRQIPDQPGRAPQKETP